MSDNDSGIMSIKYNVPTSRVVYYCCAAVAVLALGAFNAVVSAGVHQVVTRLALAALVVFGGCASHCRSTVRDFTANDFA